MMLYFSGLTSRPGSATDVLLILMRLLPALVNVSVVPAELELHLREKHVNCYDKSVVNFQRNLTSVIRGEHAEAGGTP